MSAHKYKSVWATRWLTIFDYQEDKSKANYIIGVGLRICKTHKQVMQYAKLSDPTKCVVQLYKKYNWRCPTNPPDGFFYLTPCTQIAQRWSMVLYFSTYTQ